MARGHGARLGNLDKRVMWYGRLHVVDIGQRRVRF